MADEAVVDKQAGDSPILDDVLIALQKSLSRVSNASSLVPEGQARALISGDVDFSIELNVDCRQHALQLNRDGDIRVSMHGKITPDIRVVSDETGDHDGQ